MNSSDSFSEEKLDNAEGIRRLYRCAADLARRLDNILKQANSCKDVFSCDTNILRIRLRDYCERLMFCDPLNHGKKAEDLLWRKVYYDVVVTVKKLRKNHVGAISMDHIPLCSHLTMGIGTYHHLLFRIQSEFGLEDGAADFLDMPESLISKSERVRYPSLLQRNLDSKTQDWAVNAFQRCLICLGDLARYKQELFAGKGNEISERYYAQAAVFQPLYGMPHNQQGSLSGTSNFGCDAAYHYMRSLVSEQSFEGSEGNLERVFERAQKLSQSLMDVGNTEGIVNEDESELIVKRCVTRFMKLCETCFFGEKEDNSPLHLEQLCQQVLQDFYDCTQLSLQSPETDFHTNSSIALSGELVFRLVTMALICVHQLIQKEDSSQSAAIAFALALFSHLLHNVITKLQKTLGIILNKADVPANSSEPHPSTGLINGSSLNGNSAQDVMDLHFKKIHCNQLFKRRRRKLNSCLSLEDSDLSEGEHSEGGLTDSDEGNAASDFGEAEDTAVEGSTSEEEAATELEGTGHCLQLKSGRQAEENSNNLTKTKAESKANHVKDDYKLHLKCTSLKYSVKGRSLRRNGCYYNPRRILLAVEGEELLLAVKICADWLCCHPHLFTACAQGSQLLWSRLATLLNMINPVLHMDNKEGLRPELVTCLRACKNGESWTQNWPLPEDVALKEFPLLKNVHKKLEFSTLHRLWLSNSEKALFRVACLHQFGLLLTKYSSTNLIYDTETHLFRKTSEFEMNNGTSWPISDTEHKQAVEVQRRQLMENMAHLWLQAEVTELESTVQSSNVPHLSPYLVVTTSVLVDYVTSVRQLLVSKRFIIVLPNSVIQHLDLLKKKSVQAREVMRWLEAEFHRGNRYLRAQKQHERISLSPIKYPKRKEKDVWDFFQILECCNHLMNQGASEDASNNLVTLLIGRADQKMQETEKGIWNLEAIVQSTGIKMEFIEDFLNRWHHSSKNQR